MRMMRFSRRFQSVQRSPYRDEDTSEIHNLKDPEKIFVLSGNEFLNTLLAS